MHRTDAQHIDREFNTIINVRSICVWSRRQCMQAHMEVPMIIISHHTNQFFLNSHTFFCNRKTIANIFQLHIHVQACCTSIQLQFDYKISKQKKLICTHTRSTQEWTNINIVYKGLCILKYFIRNVDNPTLKYLEYIKVEKSE